MNCEVCGAKLTGDDAVCPECGAEVAETAPAPTRSKPRSPKAKAGAPGPSTVAVPKSVFTHGAALVVGLLLGAMFFGGPAEKRASRSASMRGGTMPVGHPVTDPVTKAPPLTEEQMRQGPPPGHPAMNGMPSTTMPGSAESEPAARAAKTTQPAPASPSKTEESEP